MKYFEEKTHPLQNNEPFFYNIACYKPRFDLTKRIYRSTKLGGLTYFDGPTKFDGSTKINGSTK